MADTLSIRLYGSRQGGHTHIRVFVGPDADHRAKAGDLVFRNEEWDLLEDASRNPEAKISISMRLEEETPYV